MLFSFVSEVVGWISAANDESLAITTVPGIRELVVCDTTGDVYRSGKAEGDSEVAFSWLVWGRRLRVSGLRSTV